MAYKNFVCHTQIYALCIIYCRNNFVKNIHWYATVEAGKEGSCKITIRIHVIIPSKHQVKVVSVMECLFVYDICYLGERGRY